MTGVLDLNKMDSRVDNLPGSESSVDSDMHTGGNTHTDGNTYTSSVAETRTGGKSRRVSDPYEADPQVATVSDTHIGPQAMRDSRTGGQQKSTYYVGSEQYPRPQRAYAYAPGRCGMAELQDTEVRSGAGRALPG